MTTEEHPILEPPAGVAFDPASFEAPVIPGFVETHVVEGVKQHLRRYGAHQSIRNALRRIEDPQWLLQWGPALDTLRGAKVLFHGSEIGLFALRALGDAPGEALIFERSPLEQRMAQGIVQKSFLRRWHAAHGADITGWSEEQRRSSFEAFARNVDFMHSEPDRAALSCCDALVLPAIDHTLLGTGIVRVLRELRAAGLRAEARILPARARVFAMAIQWATDSAGFKLNPLNALRWSLYPQELNLGPEEWTALTEPVLLGELDFENFSERQWDVQLPIVSAGDLNALVFWFELDIPNGRITNAPDSALQCIKSAVQYADSMHLEAGASLQVRVCASETRLHLQPQPRPRALRSRGLPSWYVPMLRDRARNEGYSAAIDTAIGSLRDGTVLDIGAGCGLLSMMAARAGAARVVGCEVDEAIAAIGADVVALNGYSGVVSICHTDCRQMKVGTHLPARADLALFEMFDCSLIGEGVLHLLAHARAHLLKADARYLPQRARIRAVAIEYRLDQLWDVDVNILNPYRYSPSFINVDATALKYRALTEPFDVFSFDFATAGPEPEERQLEIEVVRAGIVGAVLFWFDLQVNDTLWLSNDPTGVGALHWKQGLQFLPEVMAEPQSSLPLIVGHDGSSLRFGWQQAGVAKEKCSSLPRFDPRWWQQMTELDRRTAELLQHCKRHPEERIKVARVAQCLAIDPAAHGIEPEVAQRFSRILALS